MLFTKEQDYAVRAVRALADMKQRHVKEICDSENIPVYFTYKILKKLERGGIVRAVRGREGGYILMKEPNNVSLLDIYRSTGSKMLLNDCLKMGVKCENHDDDNHCHLREALEEVQGSVLDMLGRATMDTLV